MTKEEAKQKFMEFMQEEDKEEYTQSDFDRAVSKLHEVMKKDHEEQMQKKLQEIEVLAEAQAKQKFKTEYDEIYRQQQDVLQGMREYNLKLVEELSNKTRGKDNESR